MVPHRPPVLTPRHTTMAAALLPEQPGGCAPITQQQPEPTSYFSLQVISSALEALSSCLPTTSLFSARAKMNRGKKKVQSVCSASASRKRLGTHGRVVKMCVQTTLITV